METISHNEPQDGKNNFENIDGNSVVMTDLISIAKEYIANLTGCNVIMIRHSKGGSEAAVNALAIAKDAIILKPNTPFFTRQSKCPQRVQYTIWIEIKSKRKGTHMTRPLLRQKRQSTRVFHLLMQLNLPSFLSLKLKHLLQLNSISFLLDSG